MPRFGSLSLWIIAYAAITRASSLEVEGVPKDAARLARDEAVVLRSSQAQEQLSIQTPIAVRKMGTDPGQKFFLDYWEFAPSTERVGIPGLDQTERALNVAASKAELESQHSANLTIIEIMKPPVLLHESTIFDDRSSLQIFPRSALEKRDFQCPANTNNCSYIGQSNSCCPSGDTCVSVQDTGVGPVGCCPDGATCAGTVSGCDTANGYTGCPGSSNGGCCLPGFSCQGVGCIFNSTITTTTSVAPPPSTSAPPSSSSIPSSASSAPPSTSSTPSSSPSSSASSISASSSATASAPVRPTSASSSGSDIPVPALSTSTSGTQIVYGGCPTGYYMCSAVYLGNCCQVGRNCDTSSCPPGTTSTAATDSFATVAVGTTSPGTCPSAWSSCAASEGGECCPTGYSCATNGCFATVSGGATNEVGKVPASLGYQLSPSTFWMHLMLGAAGLSFFCMLSL